MDLLSFIQTVDPIKVRVGERQRAEDEPRLLDTTAGRVVPLLPNALARAKSELDASVDKLFDECGNGNQAEQGDSASGGHGVDIQLVSEATEIVVEDAAPVQPRRQRKRKTIVSDAGGKSRSAVQRLLAGAVQNAEDFRSVDDSSTTITSTVDPATTVKKKFVESLVFGGDSSGGGVDHTAGGFPDLTGSDFIVGGIRNVISPDTDLQKVYVPQWSVTNGSRLDGGRTCREMVDEFAL
ncbi:hypothetical protein Tco_0277560 [Tanacetum coccineum]